MIFSPWSISTVSSVHSGNGGSGVSIITDLLKSSAIFQKFSNPAKHFKEYKASEADAFFAKPSSKFFYGTIVEIGDKGRENLKLVAEELDIDVESLFQMYEYVGVESINVIAKVTKGQYQEDMGNLMVKPILPRFAEEQANIYKVLQIFITIRSMRNFGALHVPITDLHIVTGKQIGRAHV